MDVEADAGAEVVVSVVAQVEAAPVVLAAEAQSAVETGAEGRGAGVDWSEAVGLLNWA